MTLLLTLAGPAAGQAWIVDVSAGAAEYEAVAGEAGTANAIFGIRREGDAWLMLYGGIPLDSATVPWISAGVGSRWSRWWRGAEFGFDAAALGFGYRVSTADGIEGGAGGGATLIALPFVGFSSPIGRVEVRSGLQHHTTTFDGETFSRALHESAVRGMVPLRDGVLLRPEARIARATEASYPYAGATLEASRGPLSAWASGGRWMAEALDASEWGIGARVALPGRLALRASYERQADDPLYWNGPRSAWSIGISRAVGRPASFEIRPLPPEVFRTAAGTVTLRVPAESAADSPSVAGDFTGWEPVPMQRRNGAWEAEFVLPAGVYHYSFRRDDGSWFLPPSVRNRVDDGFGGVNAVLVVVDP